MLFIHLTEKKEEIELGGGVVEDDVTCDSDSDCTARDIAGRVQLGARCPHRLQSLGD